MKNKEEYKRVVRAAFCIALLLIHGMLFWHVWQKFYSPLMEIPYWRRGHFLILAFYIFWIFVLSKIYGGWRVGYLKVFNLIYSQSLGILFTNILMYFMVTLLTKHLEDPRPLFFMMVVQILVTILWGAVSTRIYQLAYPPRKVLMVYGDRPVTNLMNKMSDRTDRFVIQKAVHISELSDKITGKNQEVECSIDQYEGVVICDIPSYERNCLLKYCYGKGIRTYTTPKISDLILRSAESLHMFDTPLLLSRNNGLSIEQRIIKRTADVVLSFIALVPALPIMAVIAVCIKMEDGGSVVYKQKRLTQGGREFFVYKFRSMREDAEKDGIARLAEEHDDRITKVGRVIRAVRFDELLQLFNILRGDMSIVGPRPERPEIAVEYEKEIPEFSYRLKVKAGLTGYAQVYGKYNTTAYDKLKLDLMYVQNYSLWLDLEVILKTIQILFMKESTEGIVAEKKVRAGILKDGEYIKNID